MDRHVRIFDTTLRDGEQAPGFSLRPAEKLQLARQLDALGVDIIEAGFPIASPADAEAVRRIATEIRRPVIACLARCHRADLEKAAWAIEPAAQGRIHTFIATSDLHLQAKLRMTREQCLEAAVDAVRFARQHTVDVQFSAEDATRSDFDFLCRVVEAVIKVGATTINLPDTVGYSTPDEMRDFFRRIRERVPTPRQGRLQHALPRRPRAGGRQLAGGGPGRRASGRVHDQRHRRARRQRGARRDRDGVARPAGPAAVHDEHRHQADLSVERDAHAAHRSGRAGEQGDRRPQRVRARGGHPPGRHPEGSPDLRDHARRGRGRAVEPAGARQALGPPRRAAPLRRSRRCSSKATSSSRSIAR